MTFQTFSQPETLQDLAVAEFFGHKRDGYFVDVGAYDGKHFSNTYQLEKELGWTGICVEPLRHAYDGLLAHRKCTCIHAAAYSTEGNAEFVDGDVLSGITKHVDRHTQAVAGCPRITVPTVTLASLMMTCASPHKVDYLSIDTEGSELEVLKGIDWRRHVFGYITLEHNFVEPRRAEMRRYLEERGYRHLRENHFDDDYVRA